MYKWFGLQSTVWLGHDTITTMGSLVVKGLTLITFVGMSTLLVIIQPTYVGLVSLYVLGLIFFSIERVKVNMYE